MVRQTSSRKPSKQRKRLHNLPHHRRGKVMAVHLSPSLQEEYGTRSLSVREGDTVRILRGDAKELEGKVSKVDRSKYAVHVEGITRTKQSGDTVPIPIHHSNLELVKLDLGDSVRREKVESVASQSGETS